VQNFAPTGEADYDNEIDPDGTAYGADATVDRFSIAPGAGRWQWVGTSWTPLTYQADPLPG